jgi:Acetyltransferase (GNAT) domain
MKNPIKQLFAATATVKSRRVARKTPSGFDLVLADRIDFVNAAHWDVLATQSVFLSRDYLRVLERYSPDTLTVRYAMAYADGQPVAIMLVQRIAITGDKLLKKPATTKLRDKPLAKMGEHLLVCGNVLMWGPRGAAFAPDSDPATLWRAVGEAMYRLRRADKLLGESDLMMIKDFSGNDAPSQAALRLQGFRSIDTEPDMVLSIRPEWQKHDDYLTSLTSSYRSDVKKLLKQCVQAQVVFRTIAPDEMLQRADELHALYLQVHEGQGLRLATLNPLYLPALAHIMQTRFRCRVAEIDGKAVGFVTVLLDGETAVGYYIGYDKPSNELAPIYLTLLGSCVGDAIELGAKQLSLGRTALEPKAKMGCKPVPVTCAVKHRVSMFNPILSAITKNVSHNEPPERSPFKTNVLPSSPAKASL